MSYNVNGTNILNDTVHSRTPTAPTPTQSDNSTQIATTAFVKTNLPTSTIKKTGIYMIYGDPNSSYVYIPIYYSVTNFSNITSQANTTGTVTTAQLNNAPVGSYNALSADNYDSFFIVHPGWGIIGYQETGYNTNNNGTILDYKNTNASTIITIKSVGDSKRMSSIRIYYNDVEISTPL
jgi:hypothetical protein